MPQRWMLFFLADWMILAASDPAGACTAPPGSARVPVPALSGCAAYFSPSSSTCCDKNKTDLLNINFREAVIPFLGACPACVRNLEALWCTYSCSPRQADWATNATSLRMSADYNQELYESCQDTTFRQVHAGLKVRQVYPTAENFTRHMMGFESHIEVEFVRGQGRLAFSAPLQRCQDDCTCEQCRSACTK